jgi:hypothetical protein
MRICSDTEDAEDLATPRLRGSSDTEDAEDLATPRDM